MLDDLVAPTSQPCRVAHRHRSVSQPIAPSRCLGERDHALAVTVHKAQGSEYRAVVLAAGRAPARLLSRDLLYTAVTRARELLVVVGETAIVQAMIENGRKMRRYSGLRARLAGEV